LAVPLFLFLLSCQKGAPPVATKGLPAPDFTVQTWDGKNLRLSQLRGKVVLVNFWATWCDSCKEEKPYMLRLYSLLKDNPDFRFVSILYKDDMKKAIAYEQANFVSFPVFSDPGGAAAISYGLTGVPESYIVDKNGMLREKIVGPLVGPNNWSSPRSQAFFRDLLNE
jgi:cytochrome c biogenesis protein CcmG/thiol:disulfide interchange protein DsbE